MPTPRRTPKRLTKRLIKDLKWCAEDPDHEFCLCGNEAVAILDALSGLMDGVATAASSVSHTLNRK
jgi:hypothetical protein